MEVGDAHGSGHAGGGEAGGTEAYRGRAARGEHQEQHGPQEHAATPRRGGQTGQGQLRQGRTIVSDSIIRAKHRFTAPFFLLQTAAVIGLDATGLRKTVS